MPKNAAQKSGPPVPTGVAKKRVLMTAAQRRKKIAALYARLEAIWNGEPDTGSVDHLLAERRGRA